jgi:osmoprotectant transport system permease protein
VVDGFALQDTTLIVAGALLTALLAIAAEGALAVAERAATPRGLRERRAEGRRSIADAGA